MVSAARTAEARNLRLTTIQEPKPQPELRRNKNKDKHNNDKELTKQAAP